MWARRATRAHGDERAQYNQQAAAPHRMKMACGVYVHCAVRTDPGSLRSKTHVTKYYCHIPSFSLALGLFHHQYAKRIYSKQQFFLRKRKLRIASGHPSVVPAHRYTVDGRQIRFHIKRNPRRIILFNFIQLHSARCTINIRSISLKYFHWQKELYPQKYMHITVAFREGLPSIDGESVVSVFSRRALRSSWPP